MDVRPEAVNQASGVRKSTNKTERGLGSGQGGQEVEERKCVSVCVCASVCVFSGLHDWLVVDFKRPPALPPPPPLPLPSPPSPLLPALSPTLYSSDV